MFLKSAFLIFKTLHEKMAEKHCYEPAVLDPLMSD